ncbi:MAG: YqgE/AlgH family protein [Alphaproteobacteria bacterium]
MKDKPQYLNGKLLIAMPGMGDFRFHKSVIYICAHDAQGAMGLIVNQPLPGLEFSELLEQLEILKGREQDQIKIPDITVMHGGPVEGARGFLLHSNDFVRKDTVKVDEQFFVTGTLDALRDAVVETAPEKSLFILGYAGWTSGQLDQELQQNAWLVADGNPDIVFNPDPDVKWDMAVKALGIDPAMLSATGGSA